MCPFENKSVSEFAGIWSSYSCCLFFAGFNLPYQAVQQAQIGSESRLYRVARIVGISDKIEQTISR